MSNTPSRAVPAFLASVKDASEAYEAFAAGADVIDCKDPARGALGRLDLDEIARIVKGVSALAPVSATIGDSFATPRGWRACCRGGRRDRGRDREVRIFRRPGG